MSRRVDLPGAAELFRPTGPDPVAPVETSAPRPRRKSNRAAKGLPEPTGRVRHDEKITVYVSSEELLALEQFRLQLRADYDIAVDRGRIVRAAIAEAIAEVHDHGENSTVLKRLQE